MARKVNYWMGFRPQKMTLDPKLRTLHQFGFSSQYYFLALMGVGANIFMIIGVMVILETASNPYLDILMLSLLCVNQLVIFLVELLCSFLRSKLKIWEAPVEQPQGELC